MSKLIKTDESFSALTCCALAQAIIDGKDKMEFDLDDVDYICDVLIDHIEQLRNQRYRCIDAKVIIER
jgi:hypothetical protein